MRATLFPVAAGLLLASCTFGYSDPDEFPDATSAYGRTVHLLVSVTPERQRSVKGELLWVENDALVVLARDTAWRVPLHRIDRHRLVPENPGYDDRQVWHRTVPERRFAHAARYPSPPDPGRVRALLDALGLDEVLTLGDDPGDPELEDPAPTRELEAFLDEARAAAVRFERLEVAIAEGYRRLGPSFPGMGEHWVQPGRIVEGRIDPRRPAVLCYVRLDGEPRLTSLAFTLPLGPDEPPPAEPFGRSAWHDHSDTVDEETLLLAHPASHRGSDGPRLAMVHVWVWPENPDGVLAQNNWRLPFVLAGFPVATLHPAVDAARGLSLWTADPGYYDELFRAAADPSPGEVAALRALLTEHRGRAAEWVERRRHDRLDAAAMAEAAEVWASLWERIETEVSPATWKRLAMLQ